WTTGAAIAPYMRTCKQARPVVVAVTDRRKATLFLYAHGKLEQRKTFHAYATFGPVSHMGDAPRAGYHVGVRGATGRDEEQRVMAHATNRMLKEVADEALTLSGSDGWILTGGLPRASAELAQMIDVSAIGRVLNLEALEQLRVRDLYLTHSFIEDHAAEAEDAVRSALSQGAFVEEVSRDAARKL